MRYTHKFFIILFMSSAAFALPAMAQDISPAVQAMLDNIEHQSKIKPTYKSIDTGPDGSVTINRLELNKPSEGNTPAITMWIDETILTDISDEGDGLYQIGKASFNNLSGDVSGDGFALTVEMPEGSIEGWYVKTVSDSPTPEDTLRASMSVARKVTAGKMNAAAMGQKFTMDGYETTWDGDPVTGAGKFTMKVNNIAIPEQAVAMMDQTGMLKQLGYGGLNFDFDSVGQMDIENGNIGLDFNFGVTGRDIGVVKFGIAAADVPIAVYAELQAAQETGKQPDMSALMPQVQNISFSDFSLRFEDGSITKKILPMIAAMQGMDEKGLIAMAGPMLQMGLMQFQNQAFAEQTAAAVNDFLKDPKSLTIVAKPGTPVKVSDFMTMNPNAPGEIISRLGVSVSSND